MPPSDASSHESRRLYRAFDLALLGMLEPVSNMLREGSVSALALLDGRTLLHASIDHADLAFTQLLLSLGLAVDAPDELGQSALHRCALIGSVPGARILLRLGADPLLLDPDGLTPLRMAELHHPSLLPALAEALAARERAALREASSLGSKTATARL